MVKWLWEETHDVKVMGSNPSTVPILDGHFSHISNAFIPEAEGSNPSVTNLTK